MCSTHTFFKFSGKLQYGITPTLSSGIYSISDHHINALSFENNLTRVDVKKRYTLVAANLDVFSNIHIYLTDYDTDFDVNVKYVNQ